MARAFDSSLPNNLRRRLFVPHPDKDAVPKLVALLHSTNATADRPAPALPTDNTSSFQLSAADSLTALTAFIVCLLLPGFWVDWKQA